MAEGDGPAVHVQPVGVDLEIAGGGDHLDGEGLVDLDQVDVGDGQPGPGQRPAAGLDRSEAHDLRAERADPGRHDPGQRGQAQLGGPPVAHDHHRGGPVVQRAAVAGGDGAVGPEGRFERGDGLQRGAGPGAVVAGDHGAVGQGDRGDLGLEDPVRDRLLGTVLRPDAELVLLGPGDAARSWRRSPPSGPSRCRCRAAGRRAAGRARSQLVCAYAGCAARPRRTAGFWVSAGSTPAQPKPR